MSFTLWLTGLPCSGKTTIAKELLKVLNAQHLDGDIVRKSLSKDLGFSLEDRYENLRRVSIVCKMLNDSGTNVIASFISPTKDLRKMISRNIEKSSKKKQFIEVYVKCSLKECIKRDTKGMYQKALKGEIPMFTGISAPFEEPDNPDITVDTEKLTLEEVVNKILSFLQEKEFIKPRYSLFVGRFSPPHKGHKYLFDSVLNNGGKILIAVRDTPLSEEDPLTAEQRLKLLNKLYEGNPNVRTLIIPDINEVCIGRNVGYKIMAVPERIRIISATKIRKKQKFSDVPEEIVPLLKRMLKENENKKDKSR